MGNNTKKSNEVLKELLIINLDRLRVNVEFEKKSKMVYPEGSQITKIILQIEAEINERENNKPKLKIEKQKIEILKT